MSRYSAPLRNPDLASKEWQQFFAKLKITDGEYTPVFSSLTIGGAVGDVAYAGRYFRFGGRVWFTIELTTSGSRTIASTAGATYCNPPLLIAQDNICAAVNSGGAPSYGNGIIDKAQNRIYPPTWAATTGDVLISGWYETTF